MTPSVSGATLAPPVSVDVFSKRSPPLLFLSKLLSLSLRTPSSASFFAALDIPLPLLSKTGVAWTGLINYLIARLINRINRRARKK